MGGERGFMRYGLLVFLFFASVSYCFAQTPSPSPAPTQSATPEQNRIRNFGSSLKRYEKKERQQTQAKTNESDDDVVRVSTDLVVNDVLVTNQKGNVILGLQKKDFVVTEDGTPQTIQMFAPGESATVPRSVVLIIECSAWQGPYMKTSVEAAKVLVDKLAPQDKMAIVTGDSRLALDFTADTSLIKKTLDSFVVGQARKPGFHVCGDTPQTVMGIYGMGPADTKRLGSSYNSGEFRALLAVLNEMFDEQNRQRIILFQGDGIHAMWLKPDNETPYRVSNTTYGIPGLRVVREIPFAEFGFREVKESIESSRATIYSVITGLRVLGVSKEEQLARARLSLIELNKLYKWIGESKMPAIAKYDQSRELETLTAGQTAMFKVAELSGGFTSFVEKPEDAENVYSDIFTVIKNRYVIGYSPTNRNRDGKPRQLAIQVRNHPEFTVTGRKTYFLQ